MLIPFSDFILSFLAIGFGILSRDNPTVKGMVYDDPKSIYCDHTLMSPVKKKT